MAEPLCALSSLPEWLRPSGSELAPGAGGRRGSVSAGRRALGRIVAVSAASSGPHAAPSNSGQRPSVAGAEGTSTGLGRVPSPPPVHLVAPSHGSGGAQGSRTRRLEITCQSGRLVVRAPGQPGFRLPSETPVPTGRGSCACHLGVYLSAPGSVGRPPASAITSVPLCLLHLPQSLFTRPVPGWRRAATGCGHGVRGILSLATVCSHGQVQSKDAHAELSNSKAEKRNQAPIVRLIAPAGSFPWVRKWVNSALISSVPLGLLRCD